uniref:proteasome endopeptidase complex n=1 Tax=Callorhinchus milii TaxID=7868 RepID=A0A4W3GZ25_CALMI
MCSSDSWVGVGMGDSLPVSLVPICSGSHSARPSDERIPPSPAHGTTTLDLTASELRRVAADTLSSCDSLIASPDSSKVVPVHTHTCWPPPRAWPPTAPRGSAETGVCREPEGRLGSYQRLCPGITAHTPICVCHDGTRLNGEVLSVGSGSPYAYGVLDSGYRRVMPTSEALALARTAVSHAAHRDAYSGGCVDVYTVGERGWERVGRRDVHCECELVRVCERERDSV